MPQKTLLAWRSGKNQQLGHHSLCVTSGPAGPWSPHLRTGCHCLGQRLGCCEEQDTALDWGQSRGKALRCGPDNKSAVCTALGPGPCFLTKGKTAQPQTPLPSLPLLHGETWPSLAKSAPRKSEGRDTLDAASEFLPRLLTKVAFYRRGTRCKYFWFSVGNSAATVW